MKLKEKLTKKLKKSGGFTLIEMLIVVAIIAILVAVSIPMVSSSLDKAKTATDDANERAAKAAAMIEYMINGTGTGEATYHYDAATGKAITGDGSSITPYGQKESGHVIIKFKSDGAIEVSWSGAGG